ncbi:FHA domain-containing protein [Cellulomonas sp. PhB143]|uniref:FHA domain-containing protein FhaB/FipA n=1 Tax=Cellulomonas sp. PhB143 TaxID=2485186 RepID=UPI000F47CD76|nr:FHA domain-containing protein [Cellulomonas sp. PhB143]ROS75577.1 FHA domain-containing protein [Cellulomonas sp. PhB143]
MSELTFTLLRLGYLVLLWVFVLSAIGVLRRDLYGTRSADRRKAKKSAKARAAATPAPAQVAQPVGAAAAGAAAPAAATPAPSVPRGPSRLVVTAGQLRGTSLPLSSQTIMLGRSPGCTLVLDDAFSSSRHARIFPHEGRWYLEDLGSTNGTYINDERISGTVEISQGTPVRIGRTVVELQG